MYAIPGIVGLMISIYARPWEWQKDFAEIPFLYGFMGLTMLGLIADLATRRTWILPGPTLRLATLFTVWCLITLAVQDPSLLSTKATALIVAYSLYVLIAHGVQTVRSFLVTVFTIFALGLFVAYVGADQGMNDFGCMAVDVTKGHGNYVFDGRPCPVAPDLPPDQAVMACYVNKKNVDFRCEKPGMFQTTSIDGGRVRYLGVLSDPNELALATALALPFAFAFFELRRTAVRLAILIGAVVLIAVENILTKSRSGQLIFTLVLGAYFVRRYGIRRGAIAAAVGVVPLLALGGRSGEAADQSALDRLTAAAAGIKMLLSNPISGAGFTQFTEHHPLTAHNAYVLAAAELGVPGMVMFAGMLYISTKITLTVLRYDYDEDDEEAAALKTLAMAMLAAFAGICVGVFFLSWTYHFVLWLHFGLAGAFFSIVKRKYPTFSVPMTMKEYARITGFFFVLLIALFIQIRRKGCW